MGFLEVVAPGVFGFAIGIVFGRVLKAVRTNWEGTATAVKWTITAVTFLLGGAGGAVLFRFLTGAYGPHSYLLGLGLGLLLAEFTRGAPTVSLSQVKQAILISEALRGMQPDPEKRALLVLMGIATPGAFENAAGIKEADLAKRIEDAADTTEAQG